MKTNRRIFTHLSSREKVSADEDDYEDDYEEEDDSYEDADEYDWAFEMARKEAKVG
jgi:hypothetical protein